MQNLFQEMRAIWRLALPMVIGQVATHLVQVADMAMIGRVGVTPLAAATFATNVFWIFVLFTFGLGNALSILVSEAHGRQEHSQKREILRIGLLVCGTAAALGALSLTGLVLFTDWWTLGQPAEVIAEARSYLIYLAVSMVPLLLFTSLKSYCESVDDPWTPLGHLVIAIAGNIFLNWVFIYGNLGAPEMGLDGAGLATVLARCLAVVSLWWWMSWVRHHRLRWRWREFFRFEAARKWELFKLGAPIGLQICLEVTAFNFAVFMMGWLPDGAVAIAAHSIAINYAALAFMVPLGLMFAVGIRVGQARGEGDHARARRVGWAATVMAAGFMACVALTFVSLRHQLPYLFLSESVGEDAPAVIALASLLLLFAATFAIFDGIQVVLSGALRGFRDIRVPTVITFVAYWVLCLPLGFGLAFRLDGSDHVPAGLGRIVESLPVSGMGLGAPGVWAGLCIGIGLSSTSLLLRYAVVARRSV